MSAPRKRKRPGRPKVVETTSRPRKRPGRPRVFETLDDIRQIAADVVEIDAVNAALRSAHGGDYDTEAVWDRLSENVAKERSAEEWDASDFRVNCAWLLKNPRLRKPFKDPPEAARYRPTNEEQEVYWLHRLYGVPDEVKADKRAYVRYRKRIQRIKTKFNRYLTLFAVYSYYEPDDLSLVKIWSFLNAFGISNIHESELRSVCVGKAM